MRHGVGVAVRNCLMTCIEHPRNLSPRLMSIRVRISTQRLHCQHTPLRLWRVARKRMSSISFSVSHSLPFPKAMIWFLPETLTLWLEWNTISGIALGPHDLGKMNENGQRLLELCTNYNLALTNTFFAGSINSKVTWMHPRSRRWHQ